MKNVLLVFDDRKELDFINDNLSENGFEIVKAENLKTALIKAKESVPDLIVINTSDTPKEIDQFHNQLKIPELKNTLFLCLIELEDYLKSSTRKHMVIKPVRPKLLLSLIRGIMNQEEINWLLSMN